MPPKKPRVTLSKAQLQEAAGAELLALCQTVTADGVLTDEEVYELRAWLVANRTQQLPAVEFLITTVERILADGKITKEERKELHAAIEKVLPPAARIEAASQRKAVEAAERDRVRQEQKAEKERERAERERQRPVYSVNFMVAGVHYEGRPEVIRRYVQEGDRVFLVRDPGNKYSRNAVEVRLENGYQIGFVPEDYAPEVAPLLDQGLPHVASITRMLVNTRVPIPIVYAYLYRADADVDDLVFPDAVPRKRTYTSERRPSEWEERDRPRAKVVNKGCVLLLALGSLPAAVVAARLTGLLS